jgi:hypothetical protein
MYEKAQHICENPSQICDGFEGRFMNALAEASSLIQSFAEPSPARDSVKAAILRAHRFILERSVMLGIDPSGWSFNRVRDLWYARAASRVSADELAYLNRIAPRATSIAGIVETSNDPQIAAFFARFVHLEQRVAAMDSGNRSRARDGVNRRSSG